MPPKKQPKGALSLNSTESEPSLEQPVPKSAKKTRSKKEVPAKSDAADTKPARPSHVPMDWGAPGEGGYFAFQKSYLAEKQEMLGEKFIRGDEMKAAGAAWKEKNEKQKWQDYGAAPPKPKVEREYPAGNYLKFQGEFRQKMKDQGKEEAEKGEWNGLAKAKWDTMSEKDKSAYAIILTEEEKAERAAKREEKKKAKKEAEKAAKAGQKKEAKSPKKKINKSSKVDDEEADSDDQPQRARSATPKKSTKATSRAASPSKSPAGKKGKDEAAYKKAWAKHADLDAFDVPIKQLMPDGKLKATTFAKQMKGLKLALVVNTASGCGNTKKHFAQMAELQTRFGDMGFSVLAFPSPSFSQEPKKSEEILAWAKDTHGANFPMFEKILVNGDATHPIYRGLKDMARDGKGIDNLKFNYDKFLIAVAGKNYKLVSYANSKTKPLEYVDEIDMLLK